jgi:hypothetical protein
MTGNRAEKVAIEFHNEYEYLAPSFNYKTREESAKPWRQVPKQNRDLMVAVVQNLLDRGVIDAPR